MTVTLHLREQSNGAFYETDLRGLPCPPAASAHLYSPEPERHIAMSGKSRARWIELLTAILVLTLLSWFFVDWRHQQQLNSSLLAAITHNDAQSIDSLLHQGADPNAHGIVGDEIHGSFLPEQFVRGTNEPTALILAVPGERRCVEILISSGANVNARTRIGWTALLSAVQADRPDIVKLLLEKGANPNDKAEDGRTALQQAFGNPGIEQLLRNAGATR
jgi:hypothetical protein